MRYLIAAVGGVVGGLIGMAIWVGVGYATNYEVGYVAWGIGFLVGVGVAIGSSAEGGGDMGGLAVVIAAGTIVLSKFIVFSLLVGNAQSGFDNRVDEIAVSEDDLIALEADSIIERRRAEGEQVLVSMAEVSPSIRARYPEDIWEEAKEEWDALSEDEQRKKEKDQETAIKAAVQDAIDDAAPSFTQAFGMWDALWFILAAATAFKMGAGFDDDD